MFSFLSGIWGKVIIVAAAAMAVLAILAGARKAGKDSERVKTAKKTLEIVRRQRIAANLSPTDRDGIVDSLRDGDF